MKIVQWNMTSYQTNFEELKLLIHEMGNPSCLCLQETRHGDRTLRAPSGYKIIQSQYRRDDDHERGVALLLNENVHFERIPLRLSGNIEAVAARVWSGQYYSVCSMYLSPNLPIRGRDIEDLISQLHDPLLILGDMNARHTAWGEPCQNSKGTMFYNLIVDNHLGLLNEEQKTHYCTRTGTSTLIDLSIASSSALPDFEAVVSECRYGSDHHPVAIMKRPPPVIGEPSLRFKTEKADWNEFKALTENYEKPESSSSINSNVEHLTQFILEAARASIPIATGRENGKIPVPWWDGNCEKAHRDRKRAQRALHRNHNTANAIALRKHNAICRRTFKEAKKTSWTSYVSSINEDANLNEIWKKINKIRGKFSRHPPPLLKKEDNSLTSNPTETCEILADSFSNVSSEANYPNMFKKHKKLAEARASSFSRTHDYQAPYNEPFSMQELYQALSSVSETSPGMDKISYSMIKNSHEKLKKHLLDIYNRIFTEKEFPDSWRTATIIPIPKPDKDHSNPENFRPISLTSCLCKLLEKMINSRLVWFLEREQCLDETQSGFKRNRSTTDSIVQLTCDAQRAIIRKKHTIAVFFDLKKAYDTAWRRGILDKLHQFGLYGNLPIFIENFMSQRKIQVKVGTTYSAPRTIDEGIPQGSVLSCTLFAVAINDVISQIPPQVKASLYVDDLTIYTSGSPRVAERQISITIKQLEDWCSRTGFQFCTLKTVSMHICRVKRCEKPEANLQLYGKPIRGKVTQKYLGVIVDNSLRFNKHVDYIRTDCLRRLNLLKHVSHHSWGADTKTLLRLYTAVIKPKLEYGLEAYGSTCVSNLKKLDPVQNAAMRIASGAFRTSPVMSLEVLTGIKPLAASRRERLASYIIRVLINPHNPVNRFISPEALSIANPQEENITLFEQRSFIERARDAYQSYKIDHSALWIEEAIEYAPWTVTNVAACDDLIRNAKHTIPEKTLKLIFNSHLRTHMDGQLLVYTDGSKTTDGVAFAIVGFQRSEIFSAESRKIRNEASIFAAELYAILLAVQKSTKLDIYEITIISDSKSSIQAITNTHSKNPIVNLIKEKIHESGKRFKLCWVPSHIGVHGNELADKLAREGTKKEVSTNIPILKGDIIAHIKASTKIKWRSKWQRIPEARNKLREITDDISPLSHSTNSDRRWERALSRLRLGHSKATHSYLMNGEPPPLCDWCGDDTPLTIKHVLVECPVHRNARRRIFNTATVTMATILKEGDTRPGGSVEKFVRTIGLMNML